MVTLTSLPVELLFAILEHLNLFDLDAVARTFNRALYDVAHRRLALNRGWAQHARRMRRAFLPDSSCFADLEDASVDRIQLLGFPGHFPVLEPTLKGSFLRLPPELAEKVSLDGGWEVFYTVTSPPDLRSWMKLDGSFDWLESLPKGLECVSDQSSSTHTVINAETVSCLTSQAKELGLTLPPAFTTFVQSSDIQDRMRGISLWHFEAGSRFMRCPASLDHSNGGYLLRLYRDASQTVFYLYLDRKGGNCILRSMFGCEGDAPIAEYIAWVKRCRKNGLLTRGETRAARAEGVSLAIPHTSNGLWGNGIWDADLQSLTFEEYMVTSYFEKLLWLHSVGFIFESPQGLKDYAKHVYLPIQLKDRESLKGSYHGKHAVRLREEVVYVTELSSD